MRKADVRVVLEIDDARDAVDEEVLDALGVEETEFGRGSDGLAEMGRASSTR